MSKSEFNTIPGLLIHIHRLEVRAVATPTAMRTLAIQACSMMGLSELEPELVRMSPWWCLPREAKVSSDGRALRMIDMGSDPVPASGKPPVELGAIMGWSIGLVADDQLPPHIVLVKCRGPIERYIMGVLDHLAQPEAKDGGAEMICPRCGESAPMPGDKLPDGTPAPWKCGNKWCGYYPAGAYSIGPSDSSRVYPSAACGVVYGTTTNVPLTPSFGGMLPVDNYGVVRGNGVGTPPPTREEPGEEQGPGRINIGGLTAENAAERIWRHFIEHTHSEMSLSAYREQVVTATMRKRDLTDQQKHEIINRFDLLAISPTGWNGLGRGRRGRRGHERRMIAATQQTEAPPSSNASRRWWRGNRGSNGNER
jgi:hypothetical protein